MESFSTEAFVTTMALVGVVILISALLSGLIERSGLPQVAILLGLGAALGPTGLGLIDITLDAPILRVVATLSLALVLFTDALTLDLNDVRRHGKLALLVLGPGTLLSAALIALAGWWLLGLTPPAAAILGAALASTDPVLLRGLLRRRDVPGAARQALRLESGLNDVVLLPVVLVAMVFLGGESNHGGTSWGRLALDLFLLGPGAGVVVGVLAVGTLDLIRRRIGIRRDYESLYALGVAFTAFAAAEAVHGSGFLAAFAAGLTIVALDVELCDCFLEYGETTAELALLFTFVLFGSSLIWSGLTNLTGATLVFAALALLIRPPVYRLALIPAHLQQNSRRIIAWFGPRGLSSLLLVLLPIFAGLPGTERLFSLCCLVVLLSVVLHGGAPMFFGRRPRKQSAQPAGPPQDALAALAEIPSAAPAGDAAGDGHQSRGRQAGVVGNGEAGVIPLLDARAPTAESETEDEAQGNPDRILLAELRRLREAGQPIVILDVRTERSYGGSHYQARGATRLPPDHVTERAEELGLPRDAWLVAFCA
ncbi:MAG TPA: cation:proton antiporter [Roseiflexaceae bacterium]|nr:cation:proton antiporter [Roseiflexaceae bacterium]